ncbi:hypothetical protein [Terracoccus sp. 273MFTsu3.1]|uniref:hypothetical protein n=1 Tax=Terracoccus sp. 273MFTsu3.1 TaxID=1172188 RepID=UPI0003781D86|nr:hypothetical protein [Terracoccus sp. 273MFTsu3.1]
MTRQRAGRDPYSTETPPLEDGRLRDEIELLLDVIVTASEHRRHLSPQEVDAALHLSSPDARPATHQRAG